jgi:iron complex transport system substrate-binding protein
VRTLVLAAAALVVTACGSSSSADDPVQRRIVPVNGDLAEVVWALGYGDDVVATDISATYPPAADETPKIGYQRALVAETILSFEPTIVLADDLAGPATVLDQLRAAGVDVATIERTHTLDEPAAKVRAVAGAIGVDGDDLADEVQDEIDTAIDGAGEARARAPRVMALYLRGEDVQLVFGDGSGIDAVIEAAGGIDVGTELGITDNASLSAEAVLKAAPDVILVTTSGLESVGGIEGLGAVGAIARTPAVRNEQVYAFDDQFLYGLGPRTGDLIAELAPLFATAR